ncbi:G patch domain-containing 4 [Brachionus plicatilis]|uniref:G patch domain-containing protein 4 n=1 Tax=Brachionus plicatilis TaxID=10195 RepID=A0A3M7PQ18_BRAPC|nr:G patch domain-containing 4 [Brachionus plicatilis]
MKNFSSKFAENQLKKFGWKEGDGLGRDNQGKSAPIKVSFKFDTAGVGFNLSEQFTNNWWENLYDSTSKGLEDAEQRIGKEEKPTVAMNRKEYFYSRFHQETVLVSGQEIKIDPKSEEKKEEKKEEKNCQVKNVTDEDLYKLCKGRTAHKGARHGIKMSAKLARIEEQERLLAEKMLAKLDSVDKKRKEQDSIDQEEYDADKKIRIKKKKKKSKNCDFNE